MVRPGGTFILPLTGWVGPTHTYDIVNVTELNKDYAELVKGVVNRILAMGCK